MWSIRPALKFWMELRGHKPGMIGQLDHFNQAIVRGSATDNHAMHFHTLTELIVELVAMTMTLKHNGFTVSLICVRSGSEAADPVAKAHCTAFIRHISLCVH